jgi:hypothetical protein
MEFMDTMQIENEIAKKNNRMEVSKKMGKMSRLLSKLFFLDTWPVFVHTSSPSFFLFLFLIPKNHLYKRKHIETLGTPWIVRQFTGEK